MPERTRSKKGDIGTVTDRSNKLSLVEYFYFAKDEIGDVKKFCEFFASNYDVLEKATNADYLQVSGFEETESVTLYRLKKADIMIELTLLNLRRFLTLACFWFHDDDRHPHTTIWKANIAELKLLHELLADRSFMTLGESRFYVIHEPQKEHELNEALALIDDRDMLSTKLTSGRLYHFPEAKPGTQRNFILKFDHFEKFKDSAKIFYKDLPSTDFRIQRLSRLALLYKDQTDSAMMEKKELDKEINAILHQQVAMPMDDESKLTLWENEIGDLSRMYSKLSSDGSKIREAMLNMSLDLEYLRTGLENLTEKENLENDKIFSYYIDLYKESLQDLVAKEVEVKFSVERAKAAIDLVQTQVELFRGAENVVLQSQTKELLGQNILLQEERMALQVAASFVEFVLVFYYFIGSWEVVIGLAEIELIPWYGKLGVGLLFTSSVVMATHFIAQIIKTRKFANAGFIISVILLISSLVSAIAVSVIFISSAGAAH